MKFLLTISTCLLIFQQASAQPAANAINDEEVLRRVADKILSESTLGFEGVYNQQTYGTAKDIPDTVRVRLKSTFTGWSYPNGVLNMAMLNLASFLNEPKYADHAKRQLAFAFDNYKVFEQRYQKMQAAATAGEPTVQQRRTLPFSSIFVMRELDDLGAIGASLLDVYQTEKREDYLAYLKKAANHIINIQDRFPDGTLSRKVPHPLTLWADDLYMSVPFLVRMTRLTGDKKYVDDAIKRRDQFQQIPVG